MTGKQKSEELPQLAKMWALQFEDVSDPADKREALDRYLEVVEWALNVAYEPRHSLFSGKPERFDKRPLRVLSECLKQIDNTETPDIFRPPIKGGRPPESREREFTFARASAAVTALVRDHEKSEDDAAKTVAKQLRIRGLPTPGNPTSQTPVWKALQHWRDKVTSGNKSARAQAWYNDALFFAYLCKSEKDVVDQFLEPGRIPNNPLFPDG